MLNSIDKSAVEIKNEFKNEFSTNISPKIKQFNKKRFVLAIEGIVSLIFISKTNPPNALTPVFFSLLENIKKTFKTKSVRVSIKDNSIILFIKTHNKRLNVFDWTKDMESSKAYEPFINRWLSVFNMADNLSKKS